MSQLDGPFRASEALADGLLTFRQLRRHYTAVYPGIWAPRDADLSARQYAIAAWLWSHRQGVPAGLSASALLGAKWIEPALPAELVHTNRRPPPGLVVHSGDLGYRETRVASGMRITAPARTAFDLGRRLPLTPGVQRIDALMNATGVKVCDVEQIIADHPGARGLLQLRQTLRFVDGGAESPYESLTRLVLAQRGFPLPDTQIEVLDEYGRIFARIDMGWREYCVGVDFDGAHHWTDPRQRSWDIERYAKLPELGWIDVRVNSGMLFNRREVFLDRVGTALLSRGCPKTW